MQEQANKRGGAIRLILSVLLLLLAITLFLNRQLVLDSFNAWQYTPSEAVQVLTENTTMTESAKFYFHASRPQINDRSEFNQNCTTSSEESVILGCYVAQRIYIFDIDDERLNGIEEVTAAHEMLHAAYERLSQSKKDEINALLEVQLRKVDDVRIQKLISLYEKSEPGQKLNELHSIFASELSELTPELEQYYSQYFTNRQKVVAYSKQYEEVFSSIKEQQKALVEEIENLAEVISQDSAAYSRSIEQFNADVATFNRRASSGEYNSQAQFDRDRDALVTRQQELVVLRESIATRIALYNEKIKALEAINGQAEQLNQSINSNALEPAPSL